MNVIKIECDRLKMRTIIILLATLFLYLIIAFVNLETYVYDYQLQVWEKAGEFLDLMFPLLVMLLAGEMVYEDKKNNYITYVGTRINIKDYLFQKKIGIMLCVVYMIFGISIVSFAIIQFLFPDVAQVTYNTQNFEHVWEDLYVYYPVIYVCTIFVEMCFGRNYSQSWI